MADRGGAHHGLAVRGPSVAGLRKIEVLRGVDLRILRQIAYRCRWTRFRRNEYVVRRNAGNRDVHFVISGLLRVTAGTSRGKHFVFRDIAAGDLFGESSAIDGRSHYADVLCAREALIASMSAESFRALLANQASVRERILRRLTSSVRDLAKRILDLRALPVASRVAGELLRLASPRSVDGATVLDPLPTHEQLANRIGTSREQVTRELSRLEREGLVIRQGRCLHLLNPKILGRLARDSFDTVDALDNPPEQAPDSALSLSRPHQRRALLVAEVEKTVRTMEIDESRTVERWDAYLTYINSNLIPIHEGRCYPDAIKQRFVADFPDCHRALDCALELHQGFEKFAGGRQGPAGLRIGLHLADVLVEVFQIAGDGVQVAAGLAELANPRETVISVQVRDQLTNGLNVSIEDLGEQRLHNRERPVRVFRTWPLTQAVRQKPSDAIQSHGRPSVAVIPFEVRSHDKNLQFVGVALADETIASLSRVADFFVVSRLSSMAFRQSSLTAQSIGEILGVQYVLSGTLQSVAGRVRLLAELSEARDGRVLWTEKFECSIGDVLAMQEELARLVVRSVAPFIRKLELRRARMMNDEQREAYALTMLGIDLMHRMSKEDFLSARSAFQRAIKQDPITAGPHAWLAKWHILRVATGASVNPAEEHLSAIVSADRALMCDSNDALALAVDGLVCGWSRNDLDRAQRRLAEALASNPNEPLAWLWNGIVHAWQGRGHEAVKSTDRALSLSPLDPMLYYFYSLASTANMVAGRYDRAIDFAQRSVRENCLHTPSWRTLAVSQVLANQLTEARVTVQRLRALEPDLTVGAFRARYPGRDSPQTALFIEALRTAGLPH